MGIGFFLIHNNLLFTVSNMPNNKLVNSKIVYYVYILPIATIAIG